MKSYQLEVLSPKKLNTQSIQSWFTLKGKLVREDASIHGLNLGYNTEENPDIIRDNRDLLAEFINTPKLNIAFAKQVHSNEIRNVEQGGIYLNVDGFVSKTPGIALAIQVADCAAVLFADEENGVIGACHAGWRGAVADIVLNTIKEMEDIGATKNTISVYISPCISSAKFEVGEEVASQFPDEFVIREGSRKPHIDLKAFLIHQLESAGIANERIEANKDCTYLDSQAYYSYRREGKRSGRMMGIIKLND